MRLILRSTTPFGADISTFETLTVISSVGLSHITVGVAVTSDVILTFEVSIGESSGLSWSWQPAKSRLAANAKGKMIFFIAQTIRCQPKGGVKLKDVSQLCHVVIAGRRKPFGQM